MKLKVAFIVAGLGCSSSPATASSEVHLTGSITGDATVPPCVTLKTVGGDWTLGIDTSTSVIARLAGTIDLGPSPTAGELSSDTVNDWDVEALASTSSCAFTAGGASVPTGSFALSLDTLDEATGTVHGVLDLVTYVHAPPLTDCGHGDIENVTLVF